MIMKFLNWIRKPSWEICKYCSEKISTDPDDFDFAPHINGKCVKRLVYERNMFNGMQQKANSDYLKVNRKFNDLRKGLIRVYLSASVDGDCAHLVANLLDKVDGFELLSPFDEDGEYEFKWRYDLETLKEDGDFYD